ncbi:hypothetical protein SAMN05421731_10560 [Acinetobacter puyangensis]|uniref:Uncharacterized protein n=1 Tax=Acinetobacter puyangensis TaxID=1096779 RepID=A0A240EAD0_9GAMM|nr:hypothetical protein SAMN05421731_10560 [Acinetobacter puyangensis]
MFLYSDFDRNLLNECVAKFRDQISTTYKSFWL